MLNDTLNLKINYHGDHMEYRIVEGKENIKVEDVVSTGEE